MNLEVIVLAAGKGTRMRSALPKVLHPLAGQPLLGHVLDRAGELGPSKIHVVYGHGAERVLEHYAGRAVDWVLQDEQLGTGHAVQLALPNVAGDALVLVLYGDVPLITAGTLRALIDAARPDALALLTAELEDPGAYGRIVRDRNGRVARIVEFKDASPAEAALHEINTGFLAAPAIRLKAWLRHLGNDNAQGEYYLTDIVGMAAAGGTTINVIQPGSPSEILGVNNRIELADLERLKQDQQARALMEQGVTLRDPARFDLRGELDCGRDVEIDVNVILEGKVSIGEGARIGANNVIRDSDIGAGAVIRENCVIEGATVSPGCIVGPFARLRPGTRLAGGVHVGNFVEIKNAELGEGSKANHLSYVGDATVGRGVNIGAGTITCNYDGANKHRTVIGDNAFIGSITALVAPVTVEPGATIGAGSTITQTAPAGKLTLSRSRQETIEGWERPAKKPK